MAMEEMKSEKEIPESMEVAHVSSIMQESSSAHPQQYYSCRARRTLPHEASPLGKASNNKCNSSSSSSRRAEQLPATSLNSQLPISINGPATQSIRALSKDHPQLVFESGKKAAVSLGNHSQLPEYKIDKQNHSMKTENSPPPIYLEFLDVRYKVVLKRRKLKIPLDGAKNVAEKEIIHGITGCIAPGEILALMGPSGCGKTTALNILSGRITENIQGKILYNNEPCIKSWKGRMGFVLQEDLLYPYLTVRETLIYVALLKLPRSFTKKDKIKRVEDVICDLGLEKCQGTIIGERFIRGISGGEKKRVCVGHEILTNPSILFMDEPTSGLDSTAALRMMQTTCDIAKCGRTIIISIHQPSSRLFHLFDKLLLLTEGNPIYFGKARDVLNHFSCLGFSPSISMNPADFLLDLANGYTSDISVPSALAKKDSESKQQLSPIDMEPAPKEVQEFLVESYKRTLDKNEKAIHFEVQNNRKGEAKTDMCMKQDVNATWLEQLLILLVRGLKGRRHGYLNSIRIFQVIATSLVVGLLWCQSPHNGTQDQISLLFYTTYYWVTIPLFMAIFTFPQEKAMMAKERACGMYQLSAYFIAWTLSDLPLELLLPVPFMIIVYFMTNLRHNFMTFFLTVIGILLEVINSQGLGLALGAVVMDEKKASALATVITVLFTLTSGFFVEHIPPFVAWTKYFSFNYYTFRLLLKIQFQGMKISMPSTPFYNFSLNGEWKEVIILLVSALGYRIITYVALRWAKLKI